jgi:hypothetical protein
MQINVSGFGAVVLAAVILVAAALLVAPDATTSYVNGVVSVLTGG